MEPVLPGDSKEIVVENKSFHAAKCKKCGAKIYPTSLLKPHLTRHRRRQLWFMTELRKLQHTMDHMRDIA